MSSIQKARGKTYRDILVVSWRFARGALRRLVEAELPVWMHFNEILMGEKMTDDFTPNHSYAYPVNVCAVLRFKVFAIYQWCYRWVSLVEDDGVDSEVASGDKWATGIICKANEDTVNVNTGQYRLDQLL
jgi:hypothetical protein